MPHDVRPELRVLEDVPGPVAGVLWRALTDVLLWCDAAPAERAGLFGGSSHGAASTDGLDAGLAAALDTLAALGGRNGEADPEALARACGEVAAWAEARGAKETALQFAEAAARLQPDASLRCYVAGRLSRRLGEMERARTWLRRAIRLARLARNEIDFANAHRGYGFVLTDMGRFAEAEPHFWKCVRAALRVGRKSLAGSGYHDLLMCAVHLERWHDALEFAKLAVAFYKVGHPRFPILAYDVGHFWCRFGYHSSALPVFEHVLPLVAQEPERILVLASVAHSAAVVRDHIRYQRAADRVLGLVNDESEMTAAALYRVAEGSRCFHEWEQAEVHARRALVLAQERGYTGIELLAADLLLRVQHRESGDTDVVPEENGVVDRTREQVLRRLARHPLPDLRRGLVTPERYPTE